MTATLTPPASTFRHAAPAVLAGNETSPARPRAPRLSAVWNIGHRGAPVFEVENTIASFDRALSRDGANGLELDLSMTKDGELLIWHDWQASGFEAWTRQHGFEPAVSFVPLPPDDRRLRKSVSQLYAEDVKRSFGYASKRRPRERIVSAVVPSLDDFLAFAATVPALEVVLFDFKIPRDELSAAAKMLRLFSSRLEAFKPAFRAVVETADPVVLRSLRRVSAALAAEKERDADGGQTSRPSSPLSFEYALDVGPLVGIVPSPERFSAVKSAIAYGHAIATLQKPRHSCFRPYWTFCRMARHDIALRAQHNATCAPAARVDRVIGFTLNDPYEMRGLLEMGMDGFLTDRPDRLAQVVIERASLARPVAGDGLSALSFAPR